MTHMKQRILVKAGSLVRCSKKCLIKDPVLFLTTAGGKIQCRRCVGVNSKKLQCGSPALKESRSSRCKYHSGLSRGPVSKEGIEAIRKANTKFGHFTKEAIVERKRKFAELSELAKLLNTV